MRAILIAFLIAAPALAQAPAAPPAPPAADNAATGGVVLTVLGRAYTAADVDPTAESNPTLGAARPTGEIHHVGRLGELLIRPLVERYLERNNLAPTEAEVAAATNAFRASLNTNDAVAARQRERLAAIHEALGDPTLSAEKRAGLQAELKLVEELNAAATGLPKPDAPLDPVLVDILHAIVAQWKFNKSVYDRFGGRLLNDIMGMEPLDAMRQWLEEEEREGAFTFTNDGLRDLFYARYKRDYGSSIVVGVEAKKLMSKPFWERESLDDKGAPGGRP